MCRILVLFLGLSIFISCSENEEPPIPPVVIPDIITGTVTEFTVTPIDISTPDKGIFYISSNGISYKVDFNAVAQSESNAVLVFDTDTILTDQSREFTNLGKDAVAYNPVADNEIMVAFDDGRKVNGQFNSYTSFGGTFGEQLISQWRDPNDPAKPTQKAKDDIINLVHRYADKDGAGAETSPQYLSVTVSKR